MSYRRRARHRVWKDKQWSIPVEVTLNNSGKQAGDVTVEVTVYDPSGKQVARQSARPRRRAGTSSGAGAGADQRSGPVVD
jgi:hypothetical protein